MKDREGEDNEWINRERKWILIRFAFKWSYSYSSQRKIFTNHYSAARLARLRSLCAYVFHIWKKIIVDCKKISLKYNLIIMKLYKTIVYLRYYKRISGTERRVLRKLYMKWPSLSLVYKHLSLADTFLFIFLQKSMDPFPCSYFPVCDLSSTLMKG